MSLLERFRLKEAAPTSETPVVRVVITQPSSYKELSKSLVKLPGDFDDFHKIELTQSWWIIKGPAAVNPWQVMTVGGRILDNDKKMEDSLVGNASITPEQHELTTFQIAACREALDEIHLQGVRWDQVQLFTPRPRIYTFDHPRRGLVKNAETWVTIRAPNDFRPFAFYREDKIYNVIPLSPRQVKLMWKHNQVSFEGRKFPLVDNLIDDDQRRRVVRVTANTEELLQLRDQIATHIDNEERAYRLLLVREMIYHASRHPLYGNPECKETQDGEWGLFQKWISNPEKFNTEYRRFLESFRENIPTEGSKKEKKEAQRQALISEMLHAWHRVLFKTYTDYATSVPIQGELLAAAWLPSHNATSDEFEHLELYGPEDQRRLSVFINKALMPQGIAELNLPSSYDNLKATSDGELSYVPLPASERYKRLEQYQKLLIHESDGTLSEDELLLLKIWQPYLYDTLLKELGITKFEFALFSTAWNFFSEDIARSIAPQVARKSQVSPLLARHQDALVTQLEEWLLTAHGYSPYRENRRGEVVSPQAIIDTRLKLASLLPEVKAIRYYYPAIMRTTRFWRRMLEHLTFSEEETPTQEVATAGEATDYLLERDPIEWWAEEPEIKPSEHYTICRKSTGEVIVCPTTEAPESGIAVRRRKTKLEVDDIPLYLLEITADKRLAAVKRKMWERGRPPERILDVYRTSLAIDTDSEEITRKLAENYQRYFLTSLKRLEKPLSYDQWVSDWSRRAIRDKLVPAIKAQAETLGYIFELTQLKDGLETAEPTGGSAASQGGYYELKFYTHLDLTHVLAEGSKQSEEAETIETGIYLRPQDLFTKIIDDSEYALRRYEMVEPGSGRRTLWNLLYPPSVYQVYEEIAGRARLKQLEEKRSPLARYFHRVLQQFGPIQGSIFRRQ